MEFLQGLTESPLNIAFAVGLVAALVFLFLPKDTANRAAGALRAWLANLGASDGQAPKPTPLSTRKSVLVPTRIGRLLACLEKANALRDELHALGCSGSPEHLERVRLQISCEVQQELNDGGKAGDQ